MPDTGFLFPTTFGNPSNQWTNGSNLGADDGNKATEGTVGDKEDTATYGFGIPAGSTIDGIEVEVQYNPTGSAPGVNECQVLVDLSHDGGTNYGEQKVIDMTEGDAEAIITLGGAADTWLHGWTQSETSDANFRARLIYNSETHTNMGVAVDYIKVKIYYTAPSAATVKLLAITGVG